MVVDWRTAPGPGRRCVSIQAPTALRSRSRRPPGARAAIAGRRRRPAASSSAWVPRSTTRPASSTRISSMASRPASRWVIITVVRPRVSVHQIRRSRASAVGGIEVLAWLVEDQHGEAGQQDAGDAQPLTLAAGQAGAVLADLGVEPGAGARPPRRAAGRCVQGGAGWPARLASRRANRRFSRSVVSKMWVSWAASPTTRRTSSPASGASSIPSRVTEPLVRDEAQQDRGQRGLARRRSGRRCRPGVRAPGRDRCRPAPTGRRCR